MLFFLSLIVVIVVAIAGHLFTIVHHGTSLLLPFLAFPLLPILLLHGLICSWLN